LDASNCSLALAFGKKIVDANSIADHSRVRRALVHALARKEQCTANAVVPVPRAGVFLAKCWARVRGEPVWLAFGSDQKPASMFRVSNLREDRLQHAAGKVGSIADPRIVSSVFVVDEALLSGATLSTAISTLRHHGVKVVHARTLLPPVVETCAFGVTTFVPAGNLDRVWIQSADPKNAIAVALGADTYDCLSLAQVVAEVYPRRCCVACFEKAAPEPL
jgi:amidophosphoribosyltransferase